MRVRIALTGSMLLLPLALSAEPGPPITAVFNVEVKGVRLGPDVGERLADYLGGRLAATGRYQVVPRDQLRARLVEQKKSSYKACFEQSCQIELGKELAAQKTVSTQVIRLGSQCKVTLTLYDLARAATEGGAYASGPCTEDGIVASLDEAVASPPGMRGAWCASRGEVR